MTDKEKASDAPASTGLHDLARQGWNNREIVASEALLKDCAEAGCFEFLTRLPGLRPDLSADAALKARDAFWQRILIDPIRAIGFTFPADPMSNEPCRAHVFFVIMMPGSKVYEVYRRTGHDHITYVFPRRDEWHVIIEPPVITTGRGTAPNFAEDGAMRVECPSLQGACETAESVAKTARRLGRTALIIADGVYTAQVASRGRA